MRSKKSKGEELIRELGLEAHPEGGFYKETYRSKDTIKPPGRFEGNSRNASTSILYLLEGKDFSAWHRIKSDEIWHYNAGCSLTINIIGKDKKLKRIKLGNPAEEKDAIYNYCVESGQWFCAVPNDPQGFTLTTCTVSPGFDFRDFEMGNRKSMLSDYSKNEEIKALILKFTRPSKKEEACAYSQLV